MIWNSGVSTEIKSNEGDIGSWTMIQAPGCPNVVAWMCPAPFPLSLSGHAAKWYYSLDVAKAKMWGVLIKEFIKQFSYNSMAYVTLTDLETTTQKNDETFFEFLTRWKDKTSRMINRPTEKD
jgi:hypothetical protein